jgi:hypothetical protein
MARSAISFGLPDSAKPKPVFFSSTESKRLMSASKGNFMEHEVLIRNLQFAWEAIRAIGPVAILAAATYWVTTWGEKAR